MKVLMLMIVLTTTLMTGCSGPSCEERGGKVVFSHMNLLLVPNGSGGFNQIWTPAYRCEGAVE